MENPSRLEAIEQLKIQQAELIRQYGYDQSEHGLQELVKQCDQSQVLAGLKQELLEKLNHLQKALLVNDLLIRKNQDRVRQSIRILSGHQPATQSNTYSAQGISSAQDDKRSLAQV